MPIRCLLVRMGELQNDGIASRRANDLESDRKARARKTRMVKNLKRLDKAWFPVS